MPMYKIVLRHSINNLQTIQALQRKDVPIFYGLDRGEYGPKWITIEFNPDQPDPSMIIRKYASKPNYRMVGYQTFQQLLLVPKEAVSVLFMEIAKN